jgi:hypothetical protein
MVVKDKAQATRGRGQQEEVVSHLGVQRTPRDDNVKHLVLSMLWSLSRRFGFTLLSHHHV